MQVCMCACVHVHVSVLGTAHEVPDVVVIHECNALFVSVLASTAEVKPREVTPGIFSPTTCTNFELNFSVDMVDGVFQLTSRSEVSSQDNCIVSVHVYTCTCTNFKPPILSSVFKEATCVL